MSIYGNNCLITSILLPTDLTRGGIDQAQRGGRQSGHLDGEAGPPLFLSALVPSLPRVYPPIGRVLQDVAEGPQRV